MTKEYKIQKVTEALEKLTGKKVKLKEANLTTPGMLKLVMALKDATAAAQIVYNEGQHGVNGKGADDLFHGDEGNAISGLLQDVWAAFSTGTIDDSSHNDEIFK